MPNALIDTGPLVAWFDAANADHDAVRNFMASFEDNLCTTWHVLTEVCHLLPPRTHDRLFAWVLAGGVRIFELPGQSFESIARLMRKYRDRPMDLADASLVWLGSEIGIASIVTLDVSDFSTYRLPGGGKFELLLDTRGEKTQPRGRRIRAK